MGKKPSRAGEALNKFIDDSAQGFDLTSPEAVDQAVDALNRAADALLESAPLPRVAVKKPASDRSSARVAPEAAPLPTIRPARA